MKRFLILFITIILLISLTGCGLSKDVKTQEQEALNIAQTYSLPVFYNRNNGHLMIHKSIRIRITDYDSNDGNPYFEVTVMYYDSNWFSNWNFGGTRIQYYLYQTNIPIIKTPIIPDSQWEGYTESSPTIWFYKLSDLQNESNTFEWQR
jgi:hypothetical protein